MWFNNARIYQYTLNEKIDLEASLAQESLKPCPPHARSIYGWLPKVREIADCSLFFLGKEERILPRGVIQRLLAERIQTLENQQGRVIKRAEKAQMAEDLEFELLPKSFCVQKQFPAIIDQLSNRLIINTSSENQAAQLIALLRKSVNGIHIEPIPLNENLALKFAQWISNPNLLPSPFQLASDCVLFSLDDEKKRVNCKGYELPAEEILTLLAQGLAAAEISLIWNERIQFTLTQDLTLKKIKCLDYLIDEFQEIQQSEEADQKQDAELVLFNSEMRGLIDDLLKSLHIAKLEQNLESVEA